VQFPLFFVDPFGPSAFAATRASSCQPGVGTFTYQVAFKLSQRGKDMKDQLAA
jgi:hypothetical protein